MNSAPLITVGLTCYNASSTIQRAIQSALAQDWVNKEIIVVDDCSSDGSVALIKNMEGVKLIQHESNKGAAEARNTLIRNAQGRFIAFFDDDDESAPERLKIQYERITTYENQTGAELVACYASGKRIYPNGYTLPLQAIGSSDPVPHGAGLAQRILFYGGPKDWFYGSGTPTCSLMARAEVFERVGGFDKNFRRAEDLDFAVRLALAGGHFIGCPEPLFIQHSTQSGDKSYERNLESELHLADKHKAYLQSIGQYYYARHWPRARYYHFTRRYDQMALVLFKLMLVKPFQTIRHLLATGPARLRHEAKMEGKP